MIKHFDYNVAVITLFCEGDGLKTTLDATVFDFVDLNSMER